VHAGGPGSAAAQAQLAQAEPGREAAPSAAPPGLAFVPVPTFSPDQARRFRELLAAPDAAARLAEFRALVGPLLPLRPGAPPAGAPPERDPHASNCGCEECRAARDGADGTSDKAGPGAAAVLAAAAVVRAPSSLALWRETLRALNRAC